MHLRCDVGPHGGQRVRRRCEEMTAQSPPSQASPKPNVCSESYSALSSAGLSTRASDDLGKIAGYIKKAYDLLRGCTNGVFHNTGNTASTMPTLHETCKEADKGDSTPRWLGYECAK